MLLSFNNISHRQMNKSNNLKESEIIENIDNFQLKIQRIESEIKYNSTQTLKIKKENLQIKIKTQIKKVFTIKCSEMSFLELNEYFQHCVNKKRILMLPKGRETFEEINKLLPSYLREREIISLDEETFDCLLNLLIEKESEGFVEDWHKFEEICLLDYVKRNEMEENDLLAKNRVDFLIEQPFGWVREFLFLAKEEQKKKQQLQLNERREDIEYFQTIKEGFFGVLDQKVKDEILPFNIFPKGELTTEQFLNKLKNSGVKVIDKGERSLRKIEENFDYKNRCVGEGNFKDYVVYRFNNTNLVIEPVCN